MMAVKKEGHGRSIEDLEKEITCAICHEHYTDPKILPCLHYYCKQCIRALALRTGVDKPFSCPECRTDTTLPQGGVDHLKPAFFINRMKEIHSKLSRVHGKVEAVCENCSGDKAEAFCRQCAEFICADCVRSHQKMKTFTGHKTVSLDELKEGGAKDIVVLGVPLKMCEEHDEQMKIFCFDCNKLICLYCTIKEHSGHNHELVKKAAQKVKKELLEQLKPLKKVHVNLSHSVEEINITKSKVKVQVDGVTEHIKTSFRELRQILANREQELLKETTAKGAQKLDLLSAQEKKLSTSRAVVQSVIEYTEQCLEHSADDEVMCVHAEIQSRIDREINTEVVEPLILVKGVSSVDNSSTGVSQIDLPGSESRHTDLEEAYPIAEGESHHTDMEAIAESESRHTDLEEAYPIAGGESRHTDMEEAYPIAGGESRHTDMEEAYPNAECESRHTDMEEAYPIARGESRHTDLEEDYPIAECESRHTDLEEAYPIVGGESRHTDMEEAYPNAECESRHTDLEEAYPIAGGESRHTDLEEAYQIAEDESHHTDLEEAYPIAGGESRHTDMEEAYPIARGESRHTDMEEAYPNAECESHHTDLEEAYPNAECESRHTDLEEAYPIAGGESRHTDMEEAYSNAECESRHTDMEEAYPIARGKSRHTDLEEDYPIAECESRHTDMEEAYPIAKGESRHTDMEEAYPNAECESRHTDLEEAYPIAGGESRHTDLEEAYPNAECESRHTDLEKAYPIAGGESRHTDMEEAYPNAECESRHTDLEEAYPIARGESRHTDMEEAYPNAECESRHTDLEEAYPIAGGESRHTDMEEAYPIARGESRHTDMEEAYPNAECESRHTDLEEAYPIAGGESRHTDMEEVCLTSPTEVKATVKAHHYQLEEADIKFQTQIQHTKYLVSGEGIKSAKVNRQAEFFVAGKHLFSLKCHLKSLTNNLITECEVDRVDGYKCRIQYTPTVRGRHKITLTIQGQEVAGSPFPVLVSIHPTQLVKPLWDFDCCGHSIAVNSAEEVVVAGNYDVAVYSKKGQIIKKIYFLRTYGLHPHCVTVDSDNCVYISCNRYGDHEIIKLTSTLVFMKRSGQIDGSSFQGMLINGDELMACGVVFNKELELVRKIPHSYVWIIRVIR